MDAEMTLTLADDAEACSCDWCGRAVTLDDTTDGYCPECDALQGARDEAAEALAECESEVERLKAELRDALSVLRDARKADDKTAKQLDRAWMARNAE
jgi:chromosome segregation ATPase